MGFSSGKSKAKRKAKKAAAAQYIQAIRQAEFGGEAVPEIDQAGKQKIEREYRETGMLGGRERRLAREADAVAQKANKVRGDYNDKLERYNQRKRISEAQLSGRDTRGVRDDKRVAQIDAELKKLEAEEKAYQARQPRSRQPMFSGMLWGRQQQPEFSQEQLARGQRMAALREDRNLWSGEGFQRAQGYRELGELEKTYDDLARMSYEAQGYKLSPQAQQRAERQAAQQRQMASMFGGLGGGSSGFGGIGSGVTSPFRQAGGMLGSQIGGGQSYNSMQDLIAASQAKQPAQPTKFDPKDYVKDPNSSAEQLKTKITQYNGIAEKLKQNLQRKAAGGQVLAGSAQQADLAGGELAGNLDQERFA